MHKKTQNAPSEGVKREKLWFSAFTWSSLRNGGLGMAEATCFKFGTLINQILEN